MCVYIKMFFMAECRGAFAWSTSQCIFDCWFKYMVCNKLFLVWYWLLSILEQYTIPGRVLLSLLWAQLDPVDTEVCPCPVFSLRSKRWELFPSGALWVDRHHCWGLCHRTVLWASYCTSLLVFSRIFCVSPFSSAQHRQLVGVQSDSWLREHQQQWRSQLPFPSLRTQNGLGWKI